MTRMISIADLKGKKVFSMSGEPLFEEPITKSTVQPLVFSPQISVQQPAINIPPTVVNVEPIDLLPITTAMEDMKDAILHGIAGIEHPTPFVNVEPADLSPLTEAMTQLAEAAKVRPPGHSEAIIKLLSDIASRPQATGKQPCGRQPMTSCVKQ